MAKLSVNVLVTWLDWATVEIDIGNGSRMEVIYCYPWAFCEEVASG